MLEPTPPPWEWKSDGLYSKDFPIIWVTQDVHGNLHVGVHADDEDVIAHASALYEALIPFAQRYERIRREGDNPTKVLIPFKWLEKADDILMKALYGGKTNKEEWKGLVMAEYTETVQA